MESKHPLGLTSHCSSPPPPPPSPGNFLTCSPAPGWSLLPSPTLTGAAFLEENNLRSHCHSFRQQLFSLSPSCVPGELCWGKDKVSLRLRAQGLTGHTDMGWAPSGVCLRLGRNVPTKSGLHKVLPLGGDDEAEVWRRRRNQLGQRVWRVGVGGRGRGIGGRTECARA